MNKLWQLFILHRSGTSTDVCGGEEALQEVVTKFKEAACSVDGARWITAHGVCDSADRASKAVTFLVDDVVSLALLRLY